MHAMDLGTMNSTCVVTGWPGAAAATIGGGDRGEEAGRTRSAARLSPPLAAPLEALGAGDAN